MSSKLQPVNLKERIAALEQRNNASQWPSSPPPTSTNSSFLNPQTTGGALRDKIAKFEKKGGIPVPRGSFGLGAPPLAENAPAKRRGELYGNRIPSAVRPHITGPQLTGGISTQITGPSPPNWTDHRHSFAVDGKIPGLEYDDNSEDTGGFEPPDHSLGRPQELAYASRTSSPPPVPTLSDLPGPEKVAVERRTASDSVRRGIAFATALELARKTETDKQGVYDPRSRETSLSPVHTGASSRKHSLPSKNDSQSTEPTSSGVILSTGEAEIAGADLIPKDEKKCKVTTSETQTNRLQETIHNEDRDHLQGQIQLNAGENITISIPVSPSEVKIEHSSSPGAVLDETPNKAPNSDPSQSQSVIISLTTPEESSTSDSYHTTSNVNVTSEKVLISTTLTGSPKVPIKSGAEQVNGTTKSLDSPPPPPAKLTTEASHTASLPTLPTPAELKAEALNARSETLFQEAAPSKTQGETHTDVVGSQVSSAPSTNVSGNESDSGASTGSTATIRDARGLNQDDEDDDSDLFFRPIKKRSPMNSSFEERSPAQNGVDKANSGETPALPPKDTSPDPNRLVPSTPSKRGSGSTSLSEDSSASLESSTARDSYMSQISQTITLDSRPTSMMDSSSPGHVSFAQKISAVTSRGVPIFIPASSGKQTQTVKPTTSTTTISPITSTSTVEPPQLPKRSDVPEDMGTSEFGVVTIGGGSSTQRSHLRAHTETDTQKIQNRASTFSAVVHGKVRESQTLPVTSSSNAPSTPKKRQQVLSLEPMSPGFSELSLLMQQSALLESRLMNGDYPDESVEKRETVNRRAEGREREQAADEVTKLERTNTRNSTMSSKSQNSEGKKRKLSLKKTFGMGKREASLPLEAIPATPPPPAPSGAGLKDMSRSKSMDTLRTTQPPAITPPLPSFSLEPPPLPKPGKARSFHATTDSNDIESPVPPASSSAGSTSGTGMDSDDVPPTPPPKSPPGKYLSSIRRFASSSRSHAGASSRSSVSNSSELSSDDSVTVVTPPDYSPNFTSSRTVLETRTRTRSGSRSGRTILVGGAGTPPPLGVDEDRASVITSTSGSVKWPSSSPKKGGGMSRAASFAEKMFSRSRTKSNTSSVNLHDPSDRYGTNEHGMLKAHPPSSMPALPPSVISQSPSLHELIVSEPLTLSIPEMNEPQSPNPKSTPTVTRPPSWLSTSSTGTGSSSAYSRLLDKDFFDSFPPVPETLPPSHSRANSQNTLRTLQNSSLPY